MKFLCEFYMPNDLDQTSFDRIIALHKLVKIEKNQFLFRCNEYANELYIIEKGIVRGYLQKTEEEEDLTIDFFLQNDIVVDEASVFNNEPVSINYQAISEVVAWKLSLSDFYSFFHESEAMRLWILNRVTKALSKANKKLIWMKTKNGLEKYQDILSNHPDFALNIPLKYLATYLGITDTSLSRIRRELVKRKKD
jgi:CRP/FNR family transcriptional regulator, anaerobic regulatory protein